ncbi:MAG: hypothetical protein ACRC8S_10650, partial [Fimbriiglobus sp.]
HQVRGHAGSDQYAIESKVPGEYVGDCSSTRLFLQRCAITVLALISPGVWLLLGVPIAYFSNYFLNGDWTTQTTLFYFAISISILFFLISMFAVLISLESIVCIACSRLYTRRLYEQILQRQDAVFPVNLEEIIYLEWHPRRTWNSAYGSHAAEPFFAKFDCDNDILLMEGDRHRWQIPFAAMSNVTYSLTQRDGYVQVAILHVDTIQGPQEIPLRAIMGLDGNNVYEQTGALYYMLLGIAQKNSPDHVAV